MDYFHIRHKWSPAWDSVMHNDIWPLPISSRSFSHDLWKKKPAKIWRIYAPYFSRFFFPHLIYNFLFGLYAWKVFGAAWNEKTLILVFYLLNWKVVIMTTSPSLEAVVLTVSSISCEDKVVTLKMIPVKGRWSHWKSFHMTDENMKKKRFRAPIFEISFQWPGARLGYLCC